MTEETLAVVVASANNEVSRDGNATTRSKYRAIPKREDEGFLPLVTAVEYFQPQILYFDLAHDTTTRLPATALRISVLFGGYVFLKSD